MRQCRIQAKPIHQHRLGVALCQGTRRRCPGPSPSLAVKQYSDHWVAVLARPAGFEPTAPGLGILCSILLSYGRLLVFIA